MNRRQLFKSLIIKFGAIFTGLFAVKALAKPETTENFFIVETGVSLMNMSAGEHFKYQKRLKDSNTKIKFSTYLLLGTEEEIFTKSLLNFAAVFASHYSQTKNTNMDDEMKKLIAKYNINSVI